MFRVADCTRELFRYGAAKFPVMIFLQLLFQQISFIIYCYFIFKEMMHF